MPLSAPAGDARAWADWIQQLRLQIALAKEAGRLGDINGPQDITDRLLAIVTEICRCRAETAIVTVHAVDWPGFENWAHYHRAVILWAADLRARGIIEAEPTAEAARFADTLMAYAGLAPLGVQGEETSAGSR
ncbi:MAG: hypothetical protein QOI76_3920 [Frankiales bacterium]|nr:hypothetical protein [Frankiales bacterium]